MQVKDIMIADVLSVGPGMSLSEVSDIIFQNNFHGVPVVEGKKVIGIITENDFFLKNYDDLFLPSYMKFIKENKIAGNLPPDIKEKIKQLLNARAKDLMTKDCITVSPEMETSDLMNMIKKTKFNTFPVTDSEKNLIGIVTLADILGTVKHGSIEMRRAMKKSGDARGIEEIAKEIDSYWKDKFVLISRKKVSTWKGGTLILALVAAIAVAYVVLNSGSKDSCGIGDRDTLPIECSKFSYTDWGACQANGVQTRQVIEKLPQGCEGGAFPDLTQKCQ